MKKIRLTFAALLLTGLAASGAQLSPDAALGLALGQLPTNGMKSGKWKSPSKKQFKLAHTQKSVSGSSNLIYVFNYGENDGFMVVGADDCLPGMIGYSENGAFDLAYAPESLLGMVESWSSQAEWLVSHPDAKTARVIRPQQTVAPLLGDIMWDQGNPYNKMCPNVTQYDAYGNKLATKAPAATGCVATALSQVMYYHKWPEHGTGSVRYQSDNGDDVLNISVNYEGETFDWDNMLPKLTPKSPAEAISAVSKLIYYVGTSFQSQYGMGTGASDISIAPAMKQNWGYDKAIRYLIRDFYTEHEWNDILQSELAAGRPVPYGGVTRKKAGHYFVLDGVNEEGYYHVNWGWSGEGNGYYRLELLIAEDAGTGSVNDAFSYQQNMIVGIQKPTGEKVEEQMCFTAEQIGPFDETLSRQGSVSLKAQGVWNNSATRTTAKLGFALFDSEGNVVKRVIAVDQDTYNPAYGKSVIEAGLDFPLDLAVGTYTIRPIYQLERDNYEIDYTIRLPQGRADRWTATVTEKNINVATSGKFKLNIKGVYDENGKPIGPKSKKLIINIDNEGTEFQGRAQIRCYVEGEFYTGGPTNINGKGDQYNFISLKAGDNEYVFDNTYGLSASDKYIFEIRGCEGRWDLNQKLGELSILASLDNVRIDGSASSPALKLTDAVVMSSMVDKVIPCNDIRAKAYVHNDGGNWEGNLSFQVTPSGDESNVIGYITFDSVQLERKSDTWVSLENGILPEGCTVGGKYDLTLCWDDMTMEPSRFAEVNDVTIGEAIEKVGSLNIVELITDPEIVEASKPARFTFEVGNNNFLYDDKVYFILTLNGEEAYRSGEQDFKLGGNEYDYLEFTETLPVSLFNSDNYVATLYNGKDRAMDSVGGIRFIGGKSQVGTIESERRVLVSTGCIKSAGAHHIAVYAADGTPVAGVNADEVNINGLAHGAYLARIRFADESVTVKFIK